MTVLTIPASVEHISYSAFSYNGALTLLVEKDSEAEWMAEYLGLTYRYIEGIEIVDSLWFMPDSYYINASRISSYASETELMAIALYDSGKNLKEIATDFSAQGELDATFETAVQGDFIKVFRWNSADSLHPLAVVEITLE